MKEFQRILLEMVRVQSQVAVSERALKCMARAEAEAFLDTRAKALVVHLTARMVGKSLTDRTVEEFRLPLNWWQALRERWFPRGWLRRYPVLTRIVGVEKSRTVWHVCPHFDVTVDRTHFEWLMEVDDAPH